MAKPPLRPTHGKHFTVLRHIHSSPDSTTSRRHVLIEAPPEQVDDLLWVFRWIRGKLDVSYPTGKPDDAFFAEIALPNGHGLQLVSTFAVQPYESEPVPDWMGGKIDSAHLGNDWTAFVLMLQRCGIKCAALPGIFRGGDHFDPSIPPSATMGVHDLLEAGQITVIDVEHTPFM